MSEEAATTHMITISDKATDSEVLQLLGQHMAMAGTVGRALDLLEEGEMTHESCIAYLDLAMTALTNLEYDVVIERGNTEIN